MADTFKKLASGQLPSSAATIYTAATAAIVKRIKLVNVSGSTVTGIKVFQGGTAGANQQWPTLTLLANEGVEYDCDITMAAADTLAGVAGTATAVTYTLHDMEL